MLISDTKSLERFLDSLGDAPYIALDTEFLRDKTYYPQLCLVQVAHGDKAACIDPLARIDLEPLYEWIEDPDVLKVVHAAGQDIDVFWHEAEVIPEPIFDTQIAAMVCGFGDQVGYATLVKELLDIRIDKGSQISDWSLRPLRDKQLSYALGDVTHLCKVYEWLDAELERKGRRGWVKEEFANLSDPKRVEQDPEALWRKVKLRGNDPRKLALVRELVTWREDQAKKKDKPRGWILKDQLLREIAGDPPRNQKALGRLRGMSAGQASGPLGNAIMDCVKRAEELPRSELPTQERRGPRIDVDESVTALLQTLLKLICDEHQVAPRLIATRAELDQIAAGVKPGPRALSGWRRELFGQLALDLLDGRAAISVKNGKASLTRQSEPGLGSD